MLEPPLVPLGKALLVTAAGLHSPGFVRVEEEEEEASRGNPTRCQVFKKSHVDVFLFGPKIYGNRVIILALSQT